MKIKTTKVDKILYKNYIKKALEYRTTMRESILSSNWNSASLNAIHSGISANDAILVFFHGVRSISSKHDDAVTLLRNLIKNENIKQNSLHLSKLIYAKNLVEYESRLFSSGEAHSLAKHAERFIEWVLTIIDN